MLNGSEMRASGHILRFWLTLLALAASSLTVNAEGERLAYLIEQLDYKIDGRSVARKSHTKSMIKAMRGLGFAVQRYKNLEASAIEPTLREISKDSEGAEASIVYVAGFVLEKGATGGVLPVNVDAGAPAARGVPLSRLLAVPMGKDLRLVIVDAPEDARARLALSAPETFSPYLSVPEIIPSNVLGSVTGRAPFGGYSGLSLLDRSDYFSRSFSLFFAGQKERSARRFLSKVAISVFYDSQHKLFPHVFGKQDKDFLLVRKNEVSDITAWLKLLGRPSADGFRAFIDAYPNSIYVDFARQQLETLE